jgi:hypothetical protein
VSDFPALQIVIGLSFVYFVLSLVCSAVTEAIASWLKWRATTLEKGIQNLLSGNHEITSEGRALSRQFYEHPLIQALIRPKESGKGGKALPSYIPSRTFVTALLDIGARSATTTAAPADFDPDAGPAGPDEEALARADLLPSIRAIENAQIRGALLALYREADGRLVPFQRRAEQWFDDSMERVSGWYRRRIQPILWTTAAILVVLLNVDTLLVARTLWQDDATRAAIVARAEKAVAAERAGQRVDLTETVSSLEIPLGWNLTAGDAPQDIPNDLYSILAKLVGLALTVAALTLGAPFWFDLLSKIGRIRGTGAPPPASDAVRKGEGEETRAGSGARVVET